VAAGMLVVSRVEVATGKGWVGWTAVTTLDSRLSCRLTCITAGGRGKAGHKHNNMPGLHPCAPAEAARPRWRHLVNTRLTATPAPPVQHQHAPQTGYALVWVQGCLAAHSNTSRHCEVPAQQQHAGGRTALSRRLPQPARCSQVDCYRTVLPWLRCCTGGQVAYGRADLNTANLPPLSFPSNLADVEHHKKAKV
jgi:hypothetical protein